MCAICDEAKLKPTHIALKLIATAMQNPKNRELQCLDATIGMLIGQTDSPVDGEKDAAWQANAWDRVKQ